MFAKLNKFGRGTAAAAPDDDKLGSPPGRRVEEEDPDVDRDEVVVELDEG